MARNRQVFPDEVPVEIGFQESDWRITINSKLEIADLLLTAQSSELFLENDVDHCSYVHVAVTCIGHRPTRWLSTLVKSILFYRSRPIHLHLITDDDAKLILTKLFNTWNIPQGKRFILSCAANILFNVNLQLKHPSIRIHRYLKSQ